MTIITTPHNYYSTVKPCNHNIAVISEWKERYHRTTQTLGKTFYYYNTTIIITMSVNINKIDIIM